MKDIANQKKIEQLEQTIAQRRRNKWVWRAQYNGKQQRELGKWVVRLKTAEGKGEVLCEILKETPHRFLIKLGKDCVLSRGCRVAEGQGIYLSKNTVARVAATELAR